MKFLKHIKNKDKEALSLDGVEVNIILWHNECFSLICMYTHTNKQHFCHPSLKITERLPFRFDKMRAQILEQQNNIPADPIGMIDISVGIYIYIYI